ncbi:MAG: hypothetical protein E6I73_13340 [Chloroflexi bacterium]|nr:MAG: hypothetical protein E6I73_13340 [Chloroflexota bacterium]
MGCPRPRCRRRGCRPNPRRTRSSGIVRCPRPTRHPVGRVRPPEQGRCIGRWGFRPDRRRPPRSGRSTPLRSGRQGRADQ